MATILQLFSIPSNFLFRLSRLKLFCLAHADKPGQCRNLKASYITRKSCIISWEAPLDNGGIDISNYILEMREPSKHAIPSLGWTIVGPGGASDIEQSYSLVTFLANVPFLRN